MILLLEYIREVIAKELWERFSYLNLDTKVRMRFLPITVTSLQYHRDRQEPHSNLDSENCKRLHIPQASHQGLDEILANRYHIITMR
jgi:hypothetical protein